MSEFISTCPKCRQQILCDTAYVGHRVACPVCMQEITMPEPARQSFQAAPASPGAPSGPPPATGRKQNHLIIAGVIGAVVILGLAATMFAVHDHSKAAAPTPADPTGTVQMAATAGGPAPASPVAPAQCRAFWAFDQDNGKKISDASGNGNDATLVGTNADWAKSGRNGSGALRLGGASCAEAPGQVINTAQSYTATIWVNFTALEKQHNQVVLGIDGKIVSGFYLMLYFGSRFELQCYPGDRASGKMIEAYGNFAPAPNTWYHLAAIYDAEAKNISLYVNGKWQSTVPYASAWQARGHTAIGRGFYSGHDSSFMNGMISDVRLYSTALTAAQIQELASQR